VHVTRARDLCLIENTDYLTDAELRVEPPYVELRAEPRAEPLYVELRVGYLTTACTAPLNAHQNPKTPKFQLYRIQSKWTQLTPLLLH